MLFNSVSCCKSERDEAILMRLFRSPSRRASGSRRLRRRTRERILEEVSFTREVTVFSKDWKTKVWRDHAEKIVGQRTSRLHVLNKDIFIMYFSIFILITTQFFEVRLSNLIFDQFSGSNVLNLFLFLQHQRFLIVMKSHSYSMKLI